jgi:dipeptidyl aminopeptidase/acylaminoacyl peptidase
MASLAHPDDRQLILPGRSAAYAAPGFLLFTRDGSLIARRFDSVRLEMSGEPVVLAESVAMLHGTGHFSASSNGVLVFRADSTPDFQLGWYDRKGNEIERLSLPEGARSPELAPDGQRLAFERYDPDTGWRDVWLYELDRAVASRFTFDSSTNDSDPVWSPDGSEIIFSSSRGGYPSLYRKGTGGSVDAELIQEASDGEEWPMSWSSDGQHLVYNRWSNDTSSGRLWLLSLSGEGQAELLLASEFEEVQAQFSPEGRWISYSSNESGSQEVYVERFPRTGDKWRISTDGGSDGRWRGDGREIFYLAPDRRLMAVQLNPEDGALHPSRPQALFQTGSGGPLGTGLRFNYAVSGDGQRFLIHTAAGRARPAPIVVVLNWFDELKTKMGEAGE